MSYPDRLVSAPTDLLGCLLWLDASDSASVIRSSNLVSQWSDKSGNANHATQAVGANQPTYVAAGLNGRPCLDWGSSPPVGMGLSTPSITYGAFTIFIVLNAVAGHGYPCAHWNAGGQQDYIYRQTASFYVNRAGGASSRNVSSAGGAATWLVGARVLTRRFDGTHAGNIARTLGATTWTPFDAPALGGGANDGGTGTVAGVVTIGNHPSTAEAFRGTIAEVIIFNRALSDGECIAMERYITAKWALVPSRLIASPIELTDCALWLDASDAASITKDGSNLISQWNDKSGNANHCTASGTARPLYSTYLGNAIVSFDGSNDTMVATSNIADATTGSTIVAVCRKRAVTANVNRSVVTTQSNGLYLDSATGSNSWGGQNGGFKPANEVPTTNMRVFSARRYGSSLQGGYRVRADGVQKSIASSGGSDARATTDISFSSQSADMDLLALVIYRRPLSDGELALIEDLFNRQYRLNPKRAVASPLEIPDCALWLDAAVGVTQVSGAVSAWADQSGTGTNFTQATSNKRPALLATSGPRSLPCISFDGTDDQLAAASNLSFPNGCSIFAVLAATSQGNRGTIFACKEWALYAFTSVGSQWDFFSNADSVGAGRLADTGFHYIASVNTTLVVDLTLDGSANVRALLTGAQARGSNSSIGLDPNAASHPANMRLCEFIIFSRAVTTGERTMVERYLANKYAL
jgi:hypothetical protein